MSPLIARPHTRQFAGWLLVLAVLIFAAIRVVTPAPSEAQGEDRTLPTTNAGAETVAGVTHVVEHYTGDPAARSVAAQLAARSVSVDPADRVSAFPDPSLGLGSSIQIERASVVTINDWGKSTTYHSWASTVAVLLKEQAIDLASNDKINVDKNQTPVDKMSIIITRVEEAEVQETESIPFVTATVDDPSMERGQPKLLQAGQNGVRTKTYHIRRENGLQVSKNLTKSQITTEPTSKRMAIGTHVTLFGTGIATWYDLRQGYGAASNVLPYGTKVRVVNTTNGKSVDVTIDDHGIQGRAIIDLDAEAFEQIAPLGQGVASVRLEKIY